MKENQETINFAGQLDHDFLWIWGRLVLVRSAGQVLQPYKLSAGFPKFTFTYNSCSDRQIPRFTFISELTDRWRFDQNQKLDLRTFSKNQRQLQCKPIDIPLFTPNFPLQITENSRTFLSKNINKVRKNYLRTTGTI